MKPMTTPAPKLRRNRSWREGRTSEFNVGHKISLVLGAIAALVVLYQLAMGLYSYSWPAVPGAVVSRERVRVLDVDFDRYAPSGSYEFETAGNGAVHIGTHWTLTSEEWPEGWHALPGRPVTVHYCPLDPSLAVIEPGPTWATAIWLSFALLLLGIGTSPIRAVRRARRAEQRQTEARGNRRSGGRSVSDGLDELGAAGAGSGGFFDD
jgi:hypothetical protein